MDSFRSEKLGQRPARLEPGLVKMLLLSVLLHLLLIALYLSPWLQQSSAPMPPVYEVSLVNAPVMNPQAGRPEATGSTEPTPAPVEPVPAPPPPPPPPEPAPEPEMEPEPEPETLAEPDPEPEPVPELEPELVPAIDELEEERLAEEQRQREEAEKKRLAEEQRKREEAEKRRLAEDQRKRDEAEKQRLAEEQRKREEAEKRRIAEEQRKRDEEARQRRLDELAAQRQRQADEDAREKRLKELQDKRERAFAEGRQVESPIPGAPVGMPDGRGTEAGVSPSAFVRTFIQQNWTFAGHQAMGNPEAEVYLLYNASGSLISHRFVRRSGNSAFDESLLRAVTLSRQLPQPLPQTMEFRVVFNLKEMLNR